LLVDDDRELCESVISALAPRGLEFTWKASAEDALAGLNESDWDVLIVDLSLEKMTGLALCERVVASRPHLPVILVCAHSTLEIAIAAVRAGAYDFVTKPFESTVLALAIERAARHRRLRDEVRQLREVVARATESDGMIGTSAPMREVYELIDRLSATTATVLITGKTGTGKELVARALHNRGRRGAGPFVAVNCAAIPDALLESELFGHVKGAYTDARSTRRGLFLKAQGGTLFLDEISEMSTDMQSKLLRVLQDRMIRAVGGDREENYDARIIAASNRDLEADVEQGRFREDLFYRINVLRIDLPPLAARGHDILLLAQYFLTRIAAALQKPVTGISGAAAEKLLAYEWPGNVRELENSMERAVALARREEVGLDDLPEKIRGYHGNDVSASVSVSAAAPAPAPEELLTVEEMERRHILRVLKACGGGKAAAAAILGLHLSTLYRKLEQYARDRRLPPDTSGS
jgi:two-component system response regulator HydG